MVRAPMFLNFWRADVCVNLTCSPSQTNHMTLLCGGTIGTNGREVGEQRPIQTDPDGSRARRSTARLLLETNCDVENTTPRRPTLVPARRCVHTGFSTSSKCVPLGREPAQAGVVDVLLAAHGLPHRDEMRSPAAIRRTHQRTILVELLSEHVEQGRPIRRGELGTGARNDTHAAGGVESTATGTGAGVPLSASIGTHMRAKHARS